MDYLNFKLSLIKNEILKVSLKLVLSFFSVKVISLSF